MRPKLLGAARARWVTVAAGIVLAAAAVIAVFSEAPAGLDPRGCSLDRSLSPPSFPGHVFGFDLQGCDLLVLTMAGARNSLLVGILATIFALAVAIPVGTTSGFVGGWVDGLVGRLVDLVTALPIILIGVVILERARRPRRVTRRDRHGGCCLAHLHPRDPGIHISRVRASACRCGQGAGCLSPTPARSACAAVFPRLRHRRDPSDDRLHDRGRGFAELPGRRAPTTRRLVGLLLAEAQRYIRQAPHLMLPGLFLLVVTGALVVVGESARVRVRD